ncbi:MAG TPA: Ig-like domain-containing protein [Thermoplasmata archaeon]|nr:Ig-like domain-containing protein [Thermoplasmata archaeon]
MMVLAFALLTGERCQPRDRMCTDILMTVTIGQPGVLIPDCVNSGPLQFQNREVVSFPGLSPELTTAEVPQAAGFYAIQFTSSPSAIVGTILVQLHDIPDPNFPRVSLDYVIHVTFVEPVCSGSACFDFTESASEPSVPVTGPETLTFKITNKYSGDQTDGASVSGVGFRDVLPGGVQVAAPVNVSNQCGGTVTGPTGNALAAGDTSFDLTGATVPTQSSCSLSVDVSSAQQGTYTNTSGPLEWTAPAQQGGGQITGGRASATFAVVAAAPPSLSKKFTPSTIQVNAPATLTFTLANADPMVRATGVRLTDAFPSGLQVAANTNVTNGCGGSLSGPVAGQPPAGGDATISLSGVSLSPSGQPGSECSLSLQVSSPTPGIYVNTSQAISNEGGPGQASSDQLTVIPVSSPSLASITVTPGTSTPASVVIGHAIPFTAIGNYTDGTSAPLASATWTSSAPAATVSSLGVVLGVAAANGITITAQDLATGITGTAKLNVTASGLTYITITPDPAEIASGGTVQFTATGNNSDGTTSNLTSFVAWSSSSISIATVSNASGSQGLVTGGAATSSTPVTITATDPTTGLSGSATLGVVPVPVNVSAVPQGTDKVSNLGCSVFAGASGAWHGYQDDGTTAGVSFSDPTSLDTQVTLTTPLGEGANFYVFCVATDPSTRAQGSGYAVVTLFVGILVPTVTVSPATIHAGATDVTFDGTSSYSQETGYFASIAWSVQYGGSFLPSDIEAYLTIPQSNWVTVFTDSSPPDGLLETVPASIFNGAPGAYRVQLALNDGLATGVFSFYFQVEP